MRAESLNVWARLFAALALLYLFLVGLEAMGLAFKLFGKGLAAQLIATTANPFVGLFIGVLATSLVQSSSTTTSITVGLVAGGALTIEGAIPIIMGANIGTSVTNTLVSLGHVTRREEFRRAFAGATIHDVFNWLTVLLLLPLEIAFGYLGKTASILARGVEGLGGIELLSPVKAVVKPAAEGLSALVGHSGALTLAAGVVCTFVALKFLVDVLRHLFTRQAEQVLHRTVFRNPLAAIGVGALLTIMVQSSSITTSSVIPLVGAGILTLEQVFPYTVGANLGTTVTALLAALVTGSSAAVTVALAHLLFNLNGAVVVYGIPWVRRVPLAISRWLGDLGFRNRPLAVLYVLLMFFGLPILLLILTGSLDSREANADARPEHLSSHTTSIHHPSREIPDVR